MEETVPVRLHVYDMTQGFARRWSPMLFGQQVDGIWHSGVVIRGREYFFGYGIHIEPAGKTMFGTPTQILELGSTSLSPDQFEQVLVGMRKGLFREHDYGLIYHNCNHFSHHLAQLLTGKGIPEDIMVQAEQLIKTRVGQMLTPLLSKMDGRLAGLLVSVKIDKIITAASGVTGSWLTNNTTPTANAVTVQAAAAAVVNAPLEFPVLVAAAAVLAATVAEKGPVSLIVTASASSESLPEVLTPSSEGSAT